MHTDPVINNELKELNSFLADISNVNIFTVPHGYFENLSSDLLYNIDHNLTIKGLRSSMAGMDIPAGYFDGLADNIVNKIRTDEEASGTDYEFNADFISVTKQQQVFSVPPAYFDSLPSQIISRIKSENEKADTAFINQVKHINPYTVPAGYFNSLAEIILRKVPQPAKVVSMGKRASVFNYAVAAVITALLGLSLFTMFDKKPEQFIQEEPLLMAQAGQILKNNNFDKVLETLGDEEIVSYLQNSGEDVNAALVASVTDEPSLPSEEEYFIDEKTLDNFLNDKIIIKPIAN